MNVLEVVSGRGMNGAVNHCLQLTNQLAARGHRVTIVCRPGAWIAKQPTHEHVGFLTSDLHSWPLDELRRVGQHVESHAIDVVHTHMSRAHFFGVLLKRFVSSPVVATAHSRNVQPHLMFNDRVIAVSDAVRRFQHAWNFVAASRLRMIHPFVDTSRFAPPAPSSRAQARAALGLKPDTLAIGVVGHLFREKGIVELVRVLATVRRSLPTAQLVLVGDGPTSYIARVMAEADALQQTAHLRWTGWRDDVPAIMGALDVLAVGSVEESFSMATAEAMASAVPVVAARVGGLVEVVADGITGLMVPPNDEHRMADAIVHLLANPNLRAQYGAAGRARTLERFSVDVQVAAVEDVLRQVATGRR
jgi:L-malate glycosyltransferase